MCVQKQVLGAFEQKRVYVRDDCGTGHIRYAYTTQTHTRVTYCNVIAPLHCVASTYAHWYVPVYCVNMLGFIVSISRLAYIHFINIIQHNRWYIIRAIYAIIKYGFLYAIECTVKPPVC